MNPNSGVLDLLEDEKGNIRVPGLSSVRAPNLSRVSESEAKNKSYSLCKYFKKEISDVHKRQQRLIKHLPEVTLYFRKVGKRRQS